MIDQICRVLGFLALGELLSLVCPLPIPGTIFGLLIMLASLAFIGRLPADLGRLADQVLGLFGLFFVPAGVGIVVYSGQIGADLLPIVVAIVGGSLITIGSVGVALKYIVR